jgi:hypothetical protein
MPSEMPTVTLTSDEIEVACDVLWFAKQHERLTPAGAALGERLQPLRYGDYGSDGPSVSLGNEEAEAYAPRSPSSPPAAAWIATSKPSPSASRKPDRPTKALPDRHLPVVIHRHLSMAPDSCWRSAGGRARARPVMGTGCRT